METVLTTTLGAATLALVARIIFDWLKGRRANGSQSNDASLRKVCTDVSWLRDIHERFDLDGAPLWYVPRSLGEEIGELAKAQAVTNTLLSQLLEQLRSRPL